MLKKILLSTVALVLFCVCSYASAQTGTLRANDVLRAEASDQAGSGDNVVAGTKFEVVERKGFWAKIKTGTASGWVKFSALNLDKTSSGTGSPASALSGLASGRAGSGNIVSSAGTRGLSAEELKAAKPDMAAVAQVKRLAVPLNEANSYSQAAGLNLRQIEYLGAPESK